MKNKDRNIFAGLVLVGGLMLVGRIGFAQELVRGSESYQALIRKNLELRKEVRDLESKYQGLENERKVLIIHVKDLQQSKSTTESKIQELKNMVAAARVEMMKDPQLTKKINSLNQEIDKLSKEKDHLQSKLQQLESEKAKFEKEKKEFAQEKEGHAEQIRAIDLKNQKLIDELEALKSEYARDGDELRASLETLQAEKTRLAQVNKDLSGQLGENQQGQERFEQDRKILEQKNKSLLDTLRETESKNKQLADRLADEQDVLTKAKKDWEQKLRDAQQNNQLLEKQILKANADREELNKKLAQMKADMQENEEVNRQLMKDLRHEETVLKETDKALNDEKQKRSVEKEYMNLMVKNVKADRTMLELRVKELEERISRAETERDEAMKNSLTNTAKIGLRESEIEVLKEEKSALEAKLVRYVEKLIAQSESSAMMHGQQEEYDPQEAPYTGPMEAARFRAPRLRTKKEIAEQKLKMHYNLAIAYDRMGMYKEEEKEYIKCLKINPKDTGAHYNLAILYDDKLNLNEKAIVHYKKYLELKPQGEEASQVKSWILYAEQEKRLGTNYR